MIALLGPLLSLFGGTAFRLFVGNLFDGIKQMMDHKQELERMKLQDVLDQNNHVRTMEALKNQQELGISVIRANADAQMGSVEAEGWLESIKGINTSSAMVFTTGKWWIDMIPSLIGAWNSAGRPALLTVAVTLWVLALFKSGWVMSEWDKELVGGVIGLFIGERIHATRNR